LESALQARGVVILEFQEQVRDLNKQLLDEVQDSALWKKNYNLMRTMYEAEKAKKPKDHTWVWLLRCTGVAAVAFIAGSL